MHTRATNSALATVLLWVLGAFVAARSGHAAGIPEPYNLVYGTIKLGSAEVTAADTNVVVEARRFPTAPAFVKYRMGERAAAGNYYALHLDVEQKVPGQSVSAAASEAGMIVYLTVVNGGKVMDQIQYTIGSRGTARQIDFGNVDNDNDGLPDGWEQAYLYGLSSGLEDDPDRDGESNKFEFLLGTNPLVKDARHPADINPADNRLSIQEVSAYYSAWRNGTNKWEQVLANGTKVPRDPVPIPVEYVTRATYIWERNEKYILDPNPALAAPLWWVPDQTSGTGSVGDEPLAEVDTDPGSSLLAGEALPKSGRTGSAKGAKSAMRVLTTAPAKYVAGDLLTVTNEVTVMAGLRTYAVEHYPPTGWEIVTISAGGYYDSVFKRVKWGPFFDRQPRRLTYSMRPIKPLASTRAQIQLVGASAYDGIPVTLEGQASVEILTPIVPSIVLRVGRELGKWNLQGNPGRTYELRRSTNLSKWSAVQRVTANADGLVEFTDDRALVDTTGYFTAQEVP
jgi:hypothetical protein